MKERDMRHSTIGSRDKRISRAGSKIRSSRGMTMAEMLTVVAITVILAGVAFIAVWNHQRTLAQLERDDMAREIFIAAQNHLSMVKTEGGFLQTADSDKFGFTEAKADPEDDSPTVNYLVVNTGSAGSAANDVFEMMLPWGSIEENVRGGGSYIIRYQRRTGTILDVFYCSPTGTRFGHSLSKDDYSNALDLRDTKEQNNKEARRNVAGWDGAVLGWYGGTDASVMNGMFEKPEIIVDNSAKLIVKVLDNNKAHAGDDGAVLRLLITGVTSGAQKYFTLPWSTAVPDSNISFASATPGVAGSKDIHTVIFDDVTRSGMRFASLFANKPVVSAGIEGHFIPGEDLTIKAVVYSNTKLSNIAYSNEETTNSLFESIGKTSEEGNSAEYDTAYVSNIRHLENLDSTVSNLGIEEPETANDVAEELAQGANGSGSGTAISEDGENGGEGASPGDSAAGEKKIDIKNAIQTANLIWFETLAPGSDDPRDFVTQIHKLNNPANYTVTTPDISVCWYNAAATYAGPTKSGTFKPVNLQEGFAYDGKKHSISTVSVDIDANAGLFGTLPRSSKVKNLEITDFNIKGKENAGILAGVAEGAVVENVIARNTKTYDRSSGHKNVVDVTATAGRAGGLIGYVGNSSQAGLSDVASSINYSAASLVVGGTTHAGGLIGEMSAGSVLGCYSGGHTELGEYYKHKTNAAGNLIQERLDDNAELYNVIASADSGIAGGLIGAAGGTNISSSYSTCSVSGKADSTGGFVGTASGNIKNCYCTGLVSGDYDNDKVINNAFAGSYSGGNDKLSDNHYFSIINEMEKKDEEGTVISVDYKKSGVQQLDSDDNIIDIEGKITPLDYNKSTYQGIVKGKTDWGVGIAYDPVLARYYTGKDGSPGSYNLQTVDQLISISGEVDEMGQAIAVPTGYYVNRLHYGDWPAPEIFFINQ